MNPKNDYLSFWLDRKAFMLGFFNAFDCTKLTRKNEVKVNNSVTVENIDKCQLTSIRCDQVAQFAQRLLKCDTVEQLKVNNFCSFSNEKLLIYYYL